MSSGFYSQNGRWPDPKSSRQKGGAQAGYFSHSSFSRPPGDRGKHATLGKMQSPVALELLELLATTNRRTVLSSDALTRSFASMGLNCTQRNPPYPATARLRACRSIVRQPIAAVHEYLPMCTRVYAHALRAATDSVTSIFDHEQIARPRISVLVVKSRSNDTSKCAVGHNCLRTRAVLTLCQNPTQHSNVFSWRT